MILLKYYFYFVKKTLIYSNNNIENKNTHDSPVLDIIPCSTQNEK